MERLQIRNFLNIKEADIDVGKINLIIGPQASGKSIIAKLLYFFHNFLSYTYIYSINETNTVIKKIGLFQFKQYFPQYAWSDQEFSVIFQSNGLEISVTHKKIKTGKATTTLDCSKNLANFQRTLNLLYKKKKKAEDEELDRMEEIYFRKKYLSKSEFANSFRPSIFIPAGRSFFANLQKNVFSFLASNIDIDPFIKKFGAAYEGVKRVKSYYRKLEGTELLSKIKIENMIELILVGRYKYESEQDWIEYKNKRVKLANASSGQQEALPMLIVLAEDSMIGEQSIRKSSIFFIEEPEVHLFPVSQKHIISLIALIYNKRHHDFVLTTHSPYILTAINNAIMASEVAKKAGKEAVNKIMDLDYSIKYEDVRAYTIRDGIVESIMDEESRLIGASIIDSVSDEFDNVFDSLINLQMEQSR